MSPTDPILIGRALLYGATAKTIPGKCENAALELSDSGTEILLTVSNCSTGSLRAFLVEQHYNGTGRVNVGTASETDDNGTETVTLAFTCFDVSAFAQERMVIVQSQLSKDFQCWVFSTSSRDVIYLVSLAHCNDEFRDRLGGRVLVPTIRLTSATYTVSTVRVAVDTEDNRHHVSNSGDADYEELKEDDVMTTSHLTVAQKKQTEIHADLLTTEVDCASIVNSNCSKSNPVHNGVKGDETGVSSRGIHSTSSGMLLSSPDGEIQVGEKVPTHHYDEQRRFSSGDVPSIQRGDDIDGDFGTVDQPEVGQDSVRRRTEMQRRGDDAAHARKKTTVKEGDSNDARVEVVGLPTTLSSLSWSDDVAISIASIDRYVGLVAHTCYLLNVLVVSFLVVA